MWAFGAISLTLSSQASATLLDPATLHIGDGSGGSCPTGATGTSPCNFLYNGTELNTVGQSTLDIYQNSNGAPALDSPVYLILGVANDTSGTTFDTSSFTSASIGANSVTIGGVTTSTTTVMDASHTDAYTVASTIMGQDWGQTDHSNSFGNWSDAYQSVINNIIINNFELYIVAFDTGLFSSTDGYDMLDINFTNPIPVGTFAIAYGTNIETNKLYDTPFTQAGLETSSSSSSSSTSGGTSSGTPLPEPATLPLMIVGLISLVAAGRRYARSAT